MRRTPRGTPLPERLERYIERRADGCWWWTGNKNKCGYGSIGIAYHTQLAHRVVYILHRGDIPAGLTLDHLCRNRACVNPAHLEPVTQRENTLRGNGPAAKAARKSHCLNGHPLSGDNLRLTPKGYRVCHICDLAHKRAKYTATNPYNGNKTHCPQGHEYTPENTAHYGHSRQCMTCKRERSRVRYARLKNQRDVA